ncbi:histidine kinase [Leucothrix sargassi]|nr:histidine kinase [Leucothrix sargassi]
MPRTIVGGGPKKVLYTLNTVKRIGLKQSAKALKANNTCKACGLGMGGQQGGMTNELGEFPSVCNKSIQAQSTDIQQPIPVEMFQHSTNELRELSAKELEHVGRLGNPIFKTKGSDHYKVVDWSWAMDYAAQKFAQTDPERSFFYASGRSSNEAGFLMQLVARLYGTNNITNCSYYCHQATSVGLGTTIGTGTATIELEDLSQCDLVFVIGANPSSNHPRFIHQLKNCRDRGGKVIVINPAKESGLVKFAVPKSPKSMLMGGTDIASLFLQPNIGSDIAVIKGIAKAVLDSGQQDVAFIEQYCENYQAFVDDIEATSWEMIIDRSGLTQQQIEQAAELYAQSEKAVFAWGMGITHHQHGSENVEYIANLALLRGMLGKPYSGLLPLRGHSNVQGIGTIGVKPVLPEAVFDKLESQLGVSLPTKEGMDTYHSLKAANNGEIDCACLVGGNLYAATPNSAWAADALDKIDFKLYLTTTLNQGHLYGMDNSEALILPVLVRDEERQPTTQESMFNFVRLSDGGIDRLDNLKSEIEILASLGKRLMPDHVVDFDVFQNHDTIRETIAETVPGMAQLKDISVAKDEFHVNGRIMHEPDFKTDSGKASFIIHPISHVATSSDFPLLLASIRSEGQFNSIIYEELDSYRNNAERNAVLMSEGDMQALGVNSGDKVSLVSAMGRMDNVVIRAFDIPAGNVLSYYPEANALTEHNLDPRSKTPNFKSVAVRVEVKV